MNKRKLLMRIMSRPANTRFADLVSVIEGFGFRLSRMSGSHHIYVHPDVPEPLNLQEVDGKAKPYQIRQFLRLVELYDLKLGE